MSSQRSSMAMLITSCDGQQRKVATVQPMEDEHSPILVYGRPMEITNQGVVYRSNTATNSYQKVSVNVNGVVKELMYPVQQQTDPTNQPVPIVQGLHNRNFMINTNSPIMIPLNQERLPASYSTPIAADDCSGNIMCDTSSSFYQYSNFLPPSDYKNSHTSTSRSSIKYIGNPGHPQFVNVPPQDCSIGNRSSVLRRCEKNILHHDFLLNGPLLNNSNSGSYNLNQLPHHIYTAANDLSKADPIPYFASQHCNNNLTDSRLVDRFVGMESPYFNCNYNDPLSYKLDSFPIHGRHAKPNGSTESCKSVPKVFHDNHQQSEIHFNRMNGTTKVTSQNSSNKDFEPFKSSVTEFDSLLADSKSPIRDNNPLQASASLSDLQVHDLHSKMPLLQLVSPNEMLLENSSPPGAEIGSTCSVCNPAAVGSKLDVNSTKKDSKIKGQKINRKRIYSNLKSNDRNKFAAKDKRASKDKKQYTPSGASYNTCRKTCVSFQSEPKAVELSPFDGRLSFINKSPMSDYNALQASASLSDLQACNLDLKVHLLHPISPTESLFENPLPTSSGSNKVLKGSPIADSKAPLFMKSAKCEPKLKDDVQKTKKKRKVSKSASINSCKLSSKKRRVTKNKNPLFMKSAKCEPKLKDDLQKTKKKRKVSKSASINSCKLSTNERRVTKNKKQNIFALTPVNLENHSDNMIESNSSETPMLPQPESAAKKLLSFCEGLLPVPRSQINNNIMKEVTLVSKIPRKTLKRRCETEPSFFKNFKSKMNIHSRLPSKTDVNNNRMVIPVDTRTVSAGITFQQKNYMQILPQANASKTAVVNLKDNASQDKIIEFQKIKDPLICTIINEANEYCTGGLDKSKMEQNAALNSAIISNTNKMQRFESLCKNDSIFVKNHTVALAPITSTSFELVNSLGLEKHNNMHLNKQNSLFLLPKVEPPESVYIPNDSINSNKISDVKVEDLSQQIKIQSVSSVKESEFYKVNISENGYSTPTDDSTNIISLNKDLATKNQSNSPSVDQNLYKLDDQQTNSPDDEGNANSQGECLNHSTIPSKVLPSRSCKKKRRQRKTSSSKKRHSRYIVKEKNISNKVAHEYQQMKPCSVILNRLQYIPGGKKKANVAKKSTTKPPRAKVQNCVETGLDLINREKYPKVTSTDRSYSIRSRETTTLSTCINLVEDPTIRRPPPIKTNMTNNRPAGISIPINNKDKYITVKNFFLVPTQKKQSLKDGGVQSCSDLEVEKSIFDVHQNTFNNWKQISDSTEHFSEFDNQTLIQTSVQGNSEISKLHLKNEMEEESLLWKLNKNTDINLCSQSSLIESNEDFQIDDGFGTKHIQELQNFVDNFEERYNHGYELQPDENDKHSSPEKESISYEKETNVNEKKTNLFEKKAELKGKKTKFNKRKKPLEEKNKLISKKEKAEERVKDLKAKLKQLRHAIKDAKQVLYNSKYTLDDI